MSLSMWLTVVFSVLVAAAVIGITMWVVFRRPDKAPDFSEADEYLTAKATGAPMPLVSAEPTGLADAGRRAAAARTPERVHRHAA
ncbi:MAG TPA: hypothetical protein VMV92_38325 [Streptosporangiaceae bacterium]|nr:hypothetical protein [Streptosporangiaceae bacterium]